MTLTAGTLQAGALEPVLEARALNMREPQIAAEEIKDLRALAAAVREVPGPARQTAAQAVSSLAGNLRESLLVSHREGQQECVAAGNLDDAVRTLRGRELNVPAHQAWGAKAIARRLRPALRVINAPQAHDSMSFVGAVRALDDVLARCPTGQVLGDGVRHELGERSFALLARLAADRGRA